MAEKKEFVFTSKEAYKKFLSEKLDLLNKDQEYNIYLHAIGGGVWFAIDRDNLSYEERIKYRLEGILENGLSLSRYGSLNGTAWFKGSSKNPEVIDKIFDYNFDSDTNIERTVCVIAIPKYVLIEGKVYEYSSVNGKEVDDCDEELKIAYEKIVGNVIRDHHGKSSLFDVIKEIDDLPREYLLGVQIIDNVTEDNITFIDPETHLSQISDEDKKAFEETVEKKCIKAFNTFGTDYVPDLIAKAYKVEDDKRDDYLDYD